ncbi:protein of unknown function [Enhydrobacter aerosaccus]|uniref:DUF4169 domain-containing protein n=1 Tax=Enhydrobacter aerosaccus TaxID=225324 RepID=A0A1T4SZL1_9HYPH|nr:DUF4169 family protein [Enhydrobacter aerosaccus]SKA33579.1 protein of unknown function [Enhydrobacter aerosaccus]
MAEIVNLRRRRKERARHERENEAQANRLRFGRTKAEKIADRQSETRERDLLAGKRLAPPEDESGT